MSERDDELELEKMLEAATAAELSQDEPLDKETARLREAWLALGEVLETSDAKRDNAPLIELLHRRVARRRTIRRAALALAASLLVAVTAVWYFAAREPAAQIAERPPVDDSLGDVTGDVEPLDELAWDDALDEEIAMVAWAMYEMDNPLGRTDRAVLNLWRQVDQLERELAEGVL